MLIRADYVLLASYDALAGPALLPEPDGPHEIVVPAGRGGMHEG